MILKLKSNGIWRVMEGFSDVQFSIEEHGKAMGLIPDGPTEQQDRESCKITIHAVRKNGGLCFTSSCHRDEAYILNDEGKTIQVLCSINGTPM